MTAADLLAELNERGITVEARGDRLRYSPPSAVTPDLADRMKARKGELLAILRDAPNDTAIDLTDATAAWQTVLDRLEGNPLFPTNLMEALRAADARWAADPDADGTGKETDVIDPPDPCSECGTLELWQSLVGNWRCLRCDPPTKAWQLRERAERMKTQRTDSPRMNARGDPRP